MLERMEERFYNISMYLYNKNILDYDQFARSGPKSMIRDIEGLSNIYCAVIDMTSLLHRLANHN